MTKIQIKYYAVRQGRKTGIFNTWEACKQQVDGYPGAEYKSFNTKPEAIAYLQADQSYFDEQEQMQADNNRLIHATDVAPLLEKGTVVAYTDGSYDIKKHIYGSGVYIFKPEGGTSTISCYSDDSEIAQYRNVAGELFAATQAIDWAIERKYKAIAIYHDYEGVGKWANNEWKTNNPLTQGYKQAITNKRKMIDVEFRHVKGHSGNPYNNYADTYARLGIKQGEKHSNIL